MQIKEVLNEAINATQFKLLINELCITAILKSVGSLKKLHGIHFDAEEMFENNKPVMLQKILTALLQEDLTKQLSRTLGKQLREKTQISKLKIKFDDTDDAYGHALGYTITMSNDFVSRISATIISLLMTYCRETYSFDAQVNGLFRAFELIGKKDPTFLKIAIDPIKKILNGFIVIFLHELTHVFQQSREEEKNPGGDSYYSYLDKANTFTGLHQSNASGPAYYHMYYASPQEIGAIAQSIATRLIIKLGIDKITDPDNLPKISEEQLKAEINHYITGRYQNPKSKVEYEIFKRYVKLSYLEFQYYVELTRKKLKNSVDK